MRGGREDLACFRRVRRRRSAGRLEAPACAGTRPWGDDRGFTLVEMLVALSIFAAIAAMGVGLLRSSVDTQGAVQERLKAMGGVNRLRAIMANDLAQAVARPTRGSAGEMLPAFTGSASGFSLVHAGAGAMTSGPRPDIERVGYRFAAGEWRRAVQPMLDGAMLGEGDAVAREVTAAQVRYRDDLGNWGDGWTSEPGGRLPRAVEVRITREGRAPLVMMFLVAPTPPPAPGADGEEEAP